MNFLFSFDVSLYYSFDFDILPVLEGFSLNLSAKTMLIYVVNRMEAKI